MIVKEILPNKKELTFFPNKPENRVSHVRPKARNKLDTHPLPVADKFTGRKNHMKQCFWLNAAYIRDEVYRKD